MDRINKIIIFAAGFGTRMQHLTSNKPKPLLTINNIPLLYYALDLTSQYHFEEIYINTHYHYQQIEKAIANYKLSKLNIPSITTIYEHEILETAGAIKNIHDKIGNDCIFTCNSDVIIKNNKINILEALQSNWQMGNMDMLLLLAKTEDVIGYRGNGDFNFVQVSDVFTMAPIEKVQSGEEGNYVYTGVSIVNPTRIYKDNRKIFSLREYYTSDYKIYGLCLEETKMFHASTPNDLITIEKYLGNIT